MLVGSPGLTTPYVTLTGGAIRGMFQASETLAIIVCGPNVYKLDTAGTATNIGTISDDGLPVSITGNGTSIAIASAGVLFSVETTGAVATFVRSDVAAVDFIDGYFVLTTLNAGTFYVSDLYSTTIDALSFATAEGTPDNLVGLVVSQRTVYLFGTRSVEKWYNAGGSFPLSRIDGAFYEIGCVAKNSIAKLDTPIWLGGDDNGTGSVWMMSGGQPRRISTPAIEYAISQWQDITDAEAFTYTQEGHSWYVLTSTSGNETWAYDLSTDEWHQRAWLDAGGNLDRIRPRCHLYFNGRHLVGDWQNGNVYEYDLDAFSDNENPLPRIRSCLTIQKGLETLRNVSFRLDMDTGVGLSTGQGSNPQAMLRWSKDGGKRWSNQIWRSFGRIGEYSARCWWHRVGGGERTVFEVTITDPVKVCITGAYVE